MKYKQCKYPHLISLSLAHDRGADYSVWFAEAEQGQRTTNDFAFEFARGPYEYMWVIILADTVKLDGNKATFEFQILRSPEGIPDEEFSSPQFIELIGGMIVETLNDVASNLDKASI